MKLALTSLKLAVRKLEREARPVGGWFLGTISDWAAIPENERHLHRDVLAQDFSGLAADPFADDADDRDRFADD